MDQDPVCGTIVASDRVAGRSQFQQKTYYFCSSACKEKFDSEPQLYVLQKQADDQRRKDSNPLE